MSAQWIVEGEPEFDMFPWDLTRFGHWADKKFTQEKVADQYSKRFAIHFPFEERNAGRETRTRPIYKRQKEMGAVHGLNFGWEHPLWYAGEGIVGMKAMALPVKIGSSRWVESVGTCATMWALWMFQILANMKSKVLELMIGLTVLLLTMYQRRLGGPA